jgi:2'-5' RNA ligase
MYNQLSSVIQQLSKPYNTPEFEPHVTLLGGITGDLETIILKSAKLSSMIRFYSITLEKLDHREEFYRCLFAHIRQTDAVMQANARARSVFEHAAPDHYVPHLSLMYGTIEVRIKRRIIQTIGEKLQGTFPVESIHLYSTTGSPREWFRIAQFVLAV